MSTRVNCAIVVILFVPFLYLYEVASAQTYEWGYCDIDTKHIFSTELGLKPYQHELIDGPECAIRSTRYYNLYYLIVLSVSLVAFAGIFAHRFIQQRRWH